MLFRIWRNWRRKKIKQQSFQNAWLEILKQRVPYYKKLSENDRAKLRGHIQIFINEKKFQGCAGIVITDEIRVIVAAQACLLLLHNPGDYFHQVSSILIYPHAYVVKMQKVLPGGVIAESNDARLGES